MWSNYGWAVQELETRARDMLEIDESKAIIACSSGTTACHALLYGIMRAKGKDLRVGTQDFTFATNSLGPASGPIVTDMKGDLNADLDDQYVVNSVDIMIVTNVFGHLQDIDYVQEKTTDAGKILIFDNATVPYTFWNGKNINNYGVGSFVSLHHTKLIGFGEGGIVIVDKEYEDWVRIATNYGKVGEQFNERSGNYKMSEISAAGILQYWDQFDFAELRKHVLDNYYGLKYKLRDEPGVGWINYGDDENFFPAWYPVVYDTPELAVPFDENHSSKHYYHPLRGFPVSTELYNRTLCYSMAEGWDKCLRK